MIRRLIAALNPGLCPVCGWFHSGQCHPVDRPR